MILPALLECVDVPVTLQRSIAASPLGPKRHGGPSCDWRVWREWQLPSQCGWRPLAPCPEVQQKVSPSSLSLCL